MSADYSTMIYTTEQVRHGERAAAEALDISMAQLMQRAAQACLLAIRQQQPAPARVLVLCGPGNNGGDGWVLARLAQQQGYQVQVAAAEPQSPLAKDAAAAWHDLGQSSLALDTLEDHHFQAQDIVVDALLGSGLNRDLDGDIMRAVDLINQATKRYSNWVLSVDVPTGLNSDTGQPQPMAVESHHTVTMVAVKVGLVTGLAANYCGAIELADLGIAATFYKQQPSLRVIGSHCAEHQLSPRLKASHKGNLGHLLIIAGGPGMSGAAVLAGQAALRCGVGKVSVACHPQSQLAIAVQQPELMVHVVTDDLQPLLAKADVVVIGPGLGQSEWAHQLVSSVAKWHGPVVWDADALNRLAELTVTKPVESIWYMTPHPGEAARLLKTSTSEVNADRLAALTKLCQNFQAQILLKGAGTLVQSGSQRWVCRRGSPALASGGSGDVLSGIVGALIAQGVATDMVLPLAAWLHAVAGELAARDGERGTLASDIIAELRALVNPWQVIDK
ncbi:NAD(P)H-hydrate dehydratase [Pseudidiomarina donghaiensis]|uniref:Bifunctional NAD(P)H-hydrate repair enzyme n=1 Tax=Pseudidiomarina donghaiensis TaxID=519452 RepID=A0A432XJX4_9GAMM|nr:NAD(P)H-hydrate dehydratase [Pseudidiomarina donghaiensis]RUO49074.1 bifunctional ADP-dependent NAD(P)H-hydrate dehydratase/NAD(P)H-hydrate epimerase [Pseudidiomarina donghaiensis]SFV20605.1 NAD(P)H-hydrate epimerase [Pseudidiomarina donghaiensis]